MNDYIYILDEQQTLVCILSNELESACSYNDDLKTEQLEKGLLTFEFSVPMSHPDASKIVNEGFVIRPNEEEEGSYELFRIKIDNAKKSSRFTNVSSENAAVTDLIGQIIRPNPANSKGIYASYTIAQIMEVVLSNTGWQLGRVDYQGIQDFEFKDYPTALEGLHQVLEQFGAEIRFRVEFNGTKITGKYIDMLQQRGNNTGKLFSYGYDLTDDVDRMSDTNDLVTALIGVGPNDSTGLPMTFVNYNPSVSSGYEKQSDWIGSIEARERWGNQGKHIFGVYQDQDTQNQIDLYNRTKTKLDELSKPRYTYTVGVLLLEKLAGYEAHKVSIGDNVQVKDDTFSPPLYLDARIIEKKTSKKDRTKDKVILGEFIPVLSTIPSIVQRTQNTIQTFAASGGHVVVYGPTQDDEKGFYGQSGESLTLEVTNTVHLGYASVFDVTEGGVTSGTVELRDGNDNVIESRSFDSTNLISNPDNVFEYVLKLNFVLTPGTYKLWGSFDGQTFVRFPEEVSFPYDSGEFKITGTSDPDGYYWHFFKLQVAGSGVLGGSNQTVTVGDLSNNYSAFRSLNAVGEETARIDNEQASFAVANIGIVNSESVVSYSDDDFTFYVNGVTGDDENDGLTSGTAFASIRRALSLVPRNCDGTVNINVLSDLNEVVTVSGYSGLNAININCGTRTGATAPFTYGHFLVTGGYIFDSTTKRVNVWYGRHFPDMSTYGTGNSAATVFLSKSPYIYFRECYISGRVAGTSNYSTSCVTSNDSSMAYLSQVHFQDWRSQAVRAATFGRVYLEQCTGISTQTGAISGQSSDGGSLVYVNGTSVLLNTTTVGYPAATAPASGGNIILSARAGIVQGNPTTLTYNGTNNGTAGTSTGTPGTTVTTTTYNSLDTAVSGRSYRTTKYVGWRSDIDVREGNYGYGDHKGLWFFGGTMPATPPWVGKTITGIWIELQRDVEGGAPGSIRITTHNYLTIPSGNPTLGSSFVSASFNFNEKKQVRLDQNTAIKNAFVNNTAKGIAIAGGSYAIMKVSAKLIVKWQ